MIPVVGAWYAADGDYLDAGISFAGALPVIGDAALGARIAVKGAKYAAEGAEALQGVKNAVHLGEDAKALAHGAEDTADAAKTAAADAKAAEQEAAAAKATAAGAEAESAQTAEAQGDKIATSCETGLSFAPDPPVLMGNGSTKQIGKIQVGDKVELADPRTGKLKGPNSAGPS